MWGRLIVAGHLLEDTHRPADRVAESLGFPSGSAFRNACARYVGRAPNEIRAAGGSKCVTEAFLGQLGRRDEPSVGSFVPTFLRPPLPPGARVTPRDVPVWRQRARRTPR
jgi:hypothetical protein